MKSGRIIKDITEYIFVRDVPEKSDIIFIPGSSRPELMEMAAELWKDGMASLLLPAGKYSVKTGKFAGPKTKNEIYDMEYETEWDFYRDVAIHNGVSASSILLENRSTFTKENAFFSREVTDYLGLEIKKALLCCKNFHARRALMYYEWAFPETNIMVVPVDTDGVNEENWFLSEYGMSRVMGELSRCGSQLKEAIPFFAENMMR